jgi:hypothetical protein
VCRDLVHRAEGRDRFPTARDPVLIGGFVGSGRSFCQKRTESAGKSACWREAAVPFAPPDVCNGSILRVYRTVPERSLLVQTGPHCRDDRWVLPGDFLSSKADTLETECQATTTSVATRRRCAQLRGRPRSRACARSYALRRRGSARTSSFTASKLTRDHAAPGLQRGSASQTVSSFQFGTARTAASTPTSARPCRRS